MGCCARKVPPAVDVVVETCVETPVEEISKNTDIVQNTDVEKVRGQGQNFTSAEANEILDPESLETSAAVRIAKHRAAKDEKRRLISTTSYVQDNPQSDEPLSPKTMKSVGAKMAQRRASKDKFNIARRVRAANDSFVESEKVEKLLDDIGIKSVRSASKEVRKPSKERNASKEVRMPNNDEYSRKKPSEVSELTAQTITEESFSQEQT